MFCFPFFPPKSPRASLFVGKLIGGRAAKTSFAGNLLSRLALTTALVSVPFIAQADNFVWDPSHNGSNIGGTGSWDGGFATLNFRPNNGAGANVNWADGNTAVFGTTGGNVEVFGSAFTVDGLIFGVDGYVLNPNGGALNLAGGTTVDAVVQTIGHTATLNVPIVGTGALRASGDGTLVLRGANTFTGDFSQTAGTVSLTAGSMTTDTLNISGGTFNLSQTDSVANGATIAVSGTGQLNVNANDTISSLRVTSATGAVNIANGFTLSAVGTDAAGTSFLDAGTIGGAGTFGVGQGAFVQNGGVLSVNNVNVALYALVGGEIAAGTTLTTTGNDVDLRAGTVNGVIAGARGITKSGAGLAVLNGTNTYTGQTTVEAGTLRVTADGALPNASDLVVNGGTLDVDFRQTVKSLGGTGGQIDIDNAAFLQISGNVNTTYAGNVVGGGTLRLNNMGGGLTLSGNNTVSAIAVLDGTLRLTGGQAVGDMAELTSSVGTAIVVQQSESIGTFDASGSVGLASGVTLSIGASNNDMDIGGIVSGDGSLLKEGTGLLQLTGANTYTGNTTVEAGTMRLRRAQQLNNNSNLIVNGGTLELSNLGDETVATLSGTGGVVNIRDGMGLLFVGKNGTDFTYAGRITGPGGLVKQNSGTFTVTGANDYTLSTAISGGAISVRDGGRLGANNTQLTLSNDGRLLLSGNLNVGATSLLNTSGIDLSENNNVTDRLTINGNLAMAAGTSLAVNVDGNQASDRVSVVGTVSLGGTLNVVAVGAQGTYVAPELVYTLVENDGVDAVVGTFANTQTNLAFLTPTVSTTGGDGNDVVLTLANSNTPAAGANPLALNFRPHARTRNQSGAARAMDQFNYQSADGANIRQNLLGLTNGQATQALNQIGGQQLLPSQALGGQSGGQFLSAVLGQANGGAPGSRAATSNFASAQPDQSMIDLAQAFGIQPHSPTQLSDALPNGRNTWSFDEVDENSQPAGTTISGWSQVFGEYAQVDGDTGAADLYSRTWGVAIGVETQGLFDDSSLTLGLSGGYSRASFSSSGNSSSSSDNVHIGTYAGWGASHTNDLGVGVSGALGYTYHQFESDRQIAFGALTRTAKADYDGHSFSGDARIRYGLPADIGTADVVLAPVFGVQAAHFWSGGFTETGAGGLNITSGDTDTTGVSTLLGGEAAARFVGASVTVSPRASVMWKHKFGDVSSTRSYTLAGSTASFNSQSPDVSRDSATLGVGADVEFSQQLSVSFDAGADVATTNQSYIAALRGRLSF